MTIVRYLHGTPPAMRSVMVTKTNDGRVLKVLASDGRKQDIVDITSTLAERDMAAVQAALDEQALRELAVAEARRKAKLLAANRNMEREDEMMRYGRELTADERATGSIGVTREM